MKVSFVLSLILLEVQAELIHLGMNRQEALNQPEWKLNYTQAYYSVRSLRARLVPE